jgi:NADPH:quinone reductase-like Zn-dependent oxidoreductase
MKAIVSNRYGTPGTFKLKDAEKPTPKDNEILVNIHATSINASDWHRLTVDIFLVRLVAGMFEPENTILGGELPPVWWRGV